MQHQRPQTIVAGGIGLAAAFILLWRLVKGAEGVKEFFELPVSWPITPTLILLVIFCMCIVWLGITNAEWVRAKIRDQQKKKHRDWNMSAASAIIHIADYSTSSIGRQKESAVAYAVEDFRARAKAGKIRVQGIPTGSTIPIVIPRRDWISNRLDPTSLKEDGQSTGGRLICSNEKKRLRYSSLRVDHREIEREWPTKITKNSWMRI